MADASIIDIGGTQWNIKDKEARNNIIKLEEKTTIKITNKINKTGFKMNVVEINNEKFIQLHFNFFPCSGTDGEIIGTFEQDFGMNNLVRTLVTVIIKDKADRLVANIDINTNGEIRIFYLVYNTTSSNVLPCYIHGDTFIRITI